MSPSDTNLARLLWLSVAAAVATISLKTLAWALTGSVGLLSDAAESVVNLVAAVMAIGALRWSSKPADDEHAHGHEKAGYFSAGAEGALVLIAAILIAATAIPRLLDPQPIDDAAVGLAVSVAASAINGLVGLHLLRAGRRARSVILEADGRHLLADVWTSAGVVAGVALVALTDLEVLDPIVALLVAANIVWTGSQLIRDSAGGLMDRAIPAAERAALDDVLNGFREDGIDFHAIRTRQAGSRAFVSFHVLVPGSWTVQRGHDLAEDVETATRAALPHATVFTHVEPAEDPASFDDVELNRPLRP